MTTYRFFCLCIDKNRRAMGGVFLVQVNSDEPVASLQAAIKAQLSNRLNAFDADQINVWKLEQPMLIGESALELYDRVKTLPLTDPDKSTSSDEQKAVYILRPSRAISRYWSAPPTPAEDVIHIIASVLGLPSEQNDVPSWLVDWHLKLWNQKKNPYLRTVSLTISKYRTLRQKMASSMTASPTPMDILIYKRDILEGSENTETSQDAMELDDIDATDSNTQRFKITDWLPYDLEYMDFTTLEECDRVPMLTLFRSDYKEMDNLLPDPRSSNHKDLFFVTGTPGIGKTVYLYLRLIRDLLEGASFCFYGQEGRLFHVDRSGVSIYDQRRSLTSVDEVLMDIDDPQATMPLNILRKTTIRLIVACSPNQILTHKGLNQRVDAPFRYVMQNWDEAEFWIMSLFLSNRNFVFKTLKDAVSHFGCNPRTAMRAIRSESGFGDVLNSVMEAINEIPDLQAFRKLLNRTKAAESSAPHRIFNVVSSPEGRDYFRSYLVPRSDWVFEKVMSHLEIEAFAKQRVFHELIASVPSGESGGFFGWFWERQVHSFFKRLKQPLAVELIDLGGNGGSVKWEINLEERHEEFGKEKRLSATLVQYVETSKTCYLIPNSKTFPTIDSIIYNITPPRRDLSPLVFFQITVAERHPLNTSGFDKLRKEIESQRELKIFKPEDDRKWAVVFIVPAERLDHYKKKQALEKASKAAWEKLTHQFVLGLSKEQIYGAEDGHKRKRRRVET